MTATISPAWIGDRDAPERMDDLVPERVVLDEAAGLDERSGQLPHAVEVCKAIARSVFAKPPESQRA